MLTHPRDGAPAGWYKVGVIATEPSDSKNPYSVPRSLIPEKYGKAQETKGKAKESVGRSRGKLKTERKGTADVAKGKAKQGTAKAKRTVKKATK